MKKQKSPGDRIFISMVYVLMGLMGLICLYPMWHVVMASFSDPIELMRHTGVILKPLGFSLEGYRVVIENPNILPSYFNTIVYVLVGTAINMFLTILGAYALSRKGFMLKRPLTLLIVFTMYFNAGLIPNFLLVKGLGLYNTIWALVLPGAISTWNLIVMKTSFQSIPVSLEESARLDGANDFVILFKIILPLSKAILGTLAIQQIIAIWNDIVWPTITISDPKLWTISAGLFRQFSGQYATNTPVQFAGYILASLPLILLFTFANKFYIEGLTSAGLKL